jgi:uncharacterized protein YecE (DUF72 family)
VERAPAPRAVKVPGVRILAGTSGWSYPPWRGSFYPARLPADRMLATYAARLPTVEVNATAYRAPRPELLAGWRAQAGPGFVFAVKAPQLITHRLRLRRIEAPLARFLRATAELGDGLGPLLFQLPPDLGKDLPLLRELLALLPRGGRAAFQLPPPWVAPEVVQALADAGAALCLVDAEEGTTPLAATAPFGYLRLRRPEYGDAELAAWAARLRGQPWAEAFVYFKHEDGARGPRFARRLLELAGAAAGAGPAVGDEP